MIPSIRQLREARAHDTTSDFAIPADDGSPLIDWDLDGVEGFSSALAAQFALTGSTEITDPFRLAIGRNQIAAPVELNGDDRHLAGLTCPTADHGQSGTSTGIQPHGQWIGQPPGEGWWLQIGHRWSPWLSPSIPGVAGSHEGTFYDAPASSPRPGP